MSWKKKYAISCLIALFAVAALDGYRHPGQDDHIATDVVLAAVWPVVLSVAFGSAVGEVLRNHS